MTRAFCRAAMRAGIGGCEANMAEMPPRPVMPEASKDLGRSPGSRPVSYTHLTLPTKA